MSKLAVKGGTPVRNKPWTKWPVFGDGERKNIVAALEAQGWGGFPEPAPLAREFGEKFARWTDAGYGICVSNGSITLEIALKAAGIHAGDEVIVPATHGSPLGPVRCM